MTGQLTGDVYKAYRIFFVIDVLALFFRQGLGA